VPLGLDPAVIVRECNSPYSTVSWPAPKVHSYLEFFVCCDTRLTMGDTPESHYRLWRDKPRERQPGNLEGHCLRTERTFSASVLQSQITRDAWLPLKRLERQRTPGNEQAE
jgi:hypothetical protein